MTLPAENHLSVSQVSTADFGGGAERVAADIHEKLLARGVDAHLLVGFKHHDDPGVIQIPNDRMRGLWAASLNRLAPGVPTPPRTMSASRRILRQSLKVLAEPYRAMRIYEGYDDHDFPASSHLLELTPRVPDVLHFHNMHGGYFDMRALPALAERRPTVITMHDAWLTTGHCAHGKRCQRWLRGCVECQHLDYPPAVRVDHAAANWRAKRDAFDRSAELIDFVSPSDWALQRLEHSLAARAIRATHVVRNGVDLSVFTPAADRAAARAALGIGPHDRVVAYMAASHHNAYKDAETTEGALHILASRWSGDRELVFVSIGNATPAPEPGARVVGVGYTSDKSVVAAALQASDVLLHAARAEVFPLMVAEAQAVGLPAVVTRVGGLPEVILDGETGLVVEPRSPRATAEALEALLTDEAKLAHMSRASRTHAEAELDVNDMIDGYLAVYHEAIAARRR